MARPRRARSALAAALSALVVAACVGDAAGPDPAADEWPTGTPAAYGLDAARLEALADSLRAGRFGDVGSLLVVRHGVLVVEAYFGIDYRDELVSVGSVTKSIASALFGLAVDGGLVAGPQTPIHTLLPRYADLFAADSAKRAITFHHVLTMRSGLEWSEGWPPALQPADSGDWLRLVLRQPLSSPPGTRYVYSTGSTLILSGVLAHVYGESAERVAARRLFGPLGITSYRWDADSSGLTPTGAGLWLRARDLAKVGQLYLGLGTFRGRRVLSEAWVRASVAPRLTLPSGYRYGYLWYVMPDTAASGGLPVSGVYFASGTGETRLFVLPGEDMVVVVTAYNFGGGLIPPLTFIADHILPAVLDRN